MTMYSHDGIRDSLTQLAAPTLMYEELRRELARAKRENLPISLVRFVLALHGPQNHEMDGRPYLDYQDEVIHFAHTLTRFSRDEDVCARMGEREFVCILHGREAATQIYMARISDSWRSHGVQLLRLEAASLVCVTSETGLELLNRLDLETLLPC